MSSSDIDNTVVIQQGQRQGDPSIISINCLDQPGLACDLARVLFEFNLNVVKGVESSVASIRMPTLRLNSGALFVERWAMVSSYILGDFKKSKFAVREWAMLKNCLISACPSTGSWLLRPLGAEKKHNKGLYILQTWSADRLGLLNDIASTLWELEMVVHKMKATTSPENRAVNLFYITDNRETLHHKQRQEFLCERVNYVLGDGGAHCKIIIAGPEWGGLESATVPTLLCTSNDSLNIENGDLRSLPEKSNSLSGSPQTASVVLDNSLSSAHSLLQISCKDRRGLLYDCTRTLKDFYIQVAFGRIATDSKGRGDIDLFVLEADGSKILDLERQRLLSCRLELEVVQPIKVLTSNRGLDIEFVIASPIELSGCGRPRVLHDVTSAIRKLDVSIFQPGGTGKERFS